MHIHTSKNVCLPSPRHSDPAFATIGTRFGRRKACEYGLPRTYLPGDSADVCGALHRAGSVYVLKLSCLYVAPIALKFKLKLALQDYGSARILHFVTTSMYERSSRERSVRAAPQY